MVGNIYENKRYKLLIAVPIALLLISLYFIPNLQLDQSLRGGVQINLQTNASVNTQQLTSVLNSKVPGAQASVSSSPGGLSVILTSNASLSNAQIYINNLYADYANYTDYALNITRAQTQLGQQPNNSSLRTYISQQQSAQQKSAANMLNDFSLASGSLKQLTGKALSYNQSNIATMLSSVNSGLSQASSVYKSDVIDALQAVVPFTVYSYQPIGATLSTQYLQDTQTIIIVAFILVAISVLVVFRTVVPSFSVVFGAANDIIVALGAMAALGIPIGIASIGGILMLIGYSIDTDMLAAIRILKRKEGTATERAHAALKTGTTMTFSAIIAFGVLFIVSYIAFIPTFYEISAVVLAGLVADLAITWLGNVPMILWYKHRKEARAQ